MPRATHDADFALALATSEPEALSRLLQAEFRPGEPDDPLRGVFRTSITVDDVSVPIQLVLLPPIWNALIFEDVATLPVFGCTVRVVSWQALVLLKLYAGGPQDLLDARQIVAVQQPTRADRQAVAALAETVGLSEAWHALVDR